MNAEKYLIETIFSLHPVEDIYKAVNFAKIVFSKKDKQDSLKILEYLENNVIKGIPLKICFELYYTYKEKNLNHVIIHKTKKGKIVKIPLYDLRDSMRKLYFGVIELIYKSGLLESGFDIGDSGDTSYNDGDESFG